MNMGKPPVASLESAPGHGSKAEKHVRFSLDNGLVADISGGPLHAMFGHP
jgi:hypothetical protein